MLEVCCGNLESVEAAMRGGAKRVELCTALEADGLTPPTEWVRQVREQYPSLVLHVLVRCRAGDFCYTEAEVDTLCAQVEAALEAGADGIVTGCLTPSGDVDLSAMQRLMKVVEEWNLAKELLASDLCHAAHDTHFFPGPQKRVSVTFHRAFDACPRPFAALGQIVRLGCDRILTSGQAATAEAGIPLLRKLREKACGHLLILPGGGVTPGNAARILRETGCTEIHASASEVQAGKKVTSAAKVAAILQEIHP